MSNSPAIETRGLGKKFGIFHALKNISLSLPPGRFYALMGRNGSGKSTLLRILTRLEIHDTGTGNVLGHSLEEDTDIFNAEIGYVSEATDFSFPLKICDLFQELGSFHKRWNGKAFLETLETLRIRSDRYFRDLSRGQKMQVALTYLLSYQPKILILDEVTAVLDAGARNFFLSRLQEHVGKGGTVILATNIVSEIQNFATELLLLEEGSLVLNMPRDELSQRFTKLRKLAGDRSSIYESDHCVEVSLNSDGTSSYLIPSDNLGRFKVQDSARDKRRITVEEIFIYFTKKGLTPK